MPNFSRNINNNNSLIDIDIDTLIERLLKNIIITGSVESELQNAIVRAYNSEINLGEESVSDNSNSPPDLLIGYKKNELLSLESHYSDNEVPSWRVVYDFYIRLKSQFNTRQKDIQKAKKIVKLIELYCTNNILSYSYSDKEYRTEINGKIYGTDLNSNVRQRNSLDNQFFSKSRNSNYIQTSMSIKFKISTFNTL